MEWLFGASLLSVVGLAFYMIRMARGFTAYNKELAAKLLEHFGANLQLSKENYELHNRLKDLDDALLLRTNERDREHEARLATQKLLEDSIQELATHPDASRAVASIRNSFKRLSEIVSGPRKTTTSKDREGDREVHGSVVTSDHQDGERDRDPGPEPG